MDNIINIIKQEISTTLYYLLGVKYNIIDMKVHNTNDTILEGSYIVGFFEVEGVVDSRMLFLLPTEVATALAGTMLPESNDVRESVDEDGLNVIMEIIADIFNITVSTLKSTYDIPTLKFRLVDTAFLPTVDKTTMSSFDKVLNFSVAIGNVDGKMSFIMKQDVFDCLSIITNRPATIKQHTSTTNYNDNIKVDVRVLVGNFDVTIGELNSLVAGNLFKLDTLVNEPLYIYVGGTCFAKGDVVGVDGNFGIQVTEVLGEVNG
jgi:flagellar motor switch protein FliN/FliY